MSHHWILQFTDGTSLTGRETGRAAAAQPGRIEEAIGQSTCRPGPDTRHVAWGRDQRGHLVKSFITDLSRLSGENLAAARWLSGSPRGVWRLVDASTPETAR